MRRFESGCPERKEDALEADPFASRVRDCVECDREAPGHSKYTRVTFAQALLDLKKKADEDGAGAAEASFRLATGLYNASAYGNAREVASSVSMEPRKDMKLVEKYAKRAMERAGNREKKAAACFLGAKAEQNRYYASTGENIDPTAVHSPVYFQRLKDSYSDTQYYQEVIRECGYFRRYLGR